MEILKKRIDLMKFGRCCLPSSDELIELDFDLAPSELEDDD